MSARPFPLTGIGAVVFKDKAILLVKRKNPPYQDQWAIPGGKIEAGETLQQAAEREIMEETGISIKAGAPVYVFDLIERDATGQLRFHYVIVDLEAEYIGGEIHASDDALEAGWFTADELTSLNLNPSTRKLLTEQYQL